MKSKQLLNVYNLNPPPFLGSSGAFRKPCPNLPNCSLNQSPIGCLFMVSTSLLLSVGLCLLYLENIILDVKLPSVFFRINPAVASDSFFLCQKALYHFFGEADGCAQLFHSQHLLEHRKPFERLFKQGIQPWEASC